MSVTLFYAPASPYSAKVRVCAAIAGIEINAEIVATGQEPDNLLVANPLGKIPCLVLEDGTGVFDSRTITQELDRMSGKLLFPRNAMKRREAERLEAAADGLCDALLAQVYEKRFRPAEKVEQSWLDYQARKVERTLDWLNDNCTMRGKPHVGHIALACAIGYAQLRFPDLAWSRGRPKLKRFYGKLSETVGAFEGLKPSA
ncbi:MAG: glutathione S-transferase family protein [Pseudomonadota bacterium]